MTQISVLIVDDEKEMQVKIKETLTKSYFKRVFCASSTSEMMKILREEIIDVILLDNHLGNSVQGCNYISEIKKINSDIEVIMITADRSVDLIIKAIKNGAYYYLPKDKGAPIELIALIKNAFDLKKTREEHKALSEAYTFLQENNLSFEVIGNSKNLADIKLKLEKLAKTKATNCLLFSGEDGVGKNEMAQYFYSLISKENKFRPFFKIPCESLDKESFKTIFYGNGTSFKKGILEISCSSVILFEDISKLSLDLQSQVLSLIRQREIHLNISGKVLKQNNNLLIMATSNLDIKATEHTSTFNKDLFYEISTVSFNLSPLRERTSDIAQLIQHFIQQISKSLNTSFPSLPQNIYDMLLSYPWPGNISELKSVLEKLLILGFQDGEYNINELPERFLAESYDLRNAHLTEVGDSTAILKEIIESKRSYTEKMFMCRKIIIEESLKKNNFVIAHAAKELQRHRTSFHRDLNELNIAVQDLS